ncbi:MAG: RsfA family transcriptional regulator [Hydrogenibacillus sp.]|nr:RsfA family transcriptional regulator [Hydrogenibacillus sp.]
MVAHRQDAWREEEDLLLAETVLRHIREGSTQLKAFEECQTALGRTAAACGFRWNSVVRKHYEDDILLAKVSGREARRRRVAGEGVFRERKADVSPVSETTAEEAVRSGDASAHAKRGAARGKTARRARAGALTYRQVLRFLREEAKRVEALAREAAALRMQLREKEDEIARLQDELALLRESRADRPAAGEDYETLLKIIDRARNLVEREAEKTPPSDASGAGRPAAQAL